MQPEKKENKLMNFIKGGGVAGFLGRKIFGKKDKEINHKRTIQQIQNQQHLVSRFSTQED